VITFAGNRHIHSGEAEAARRVINDVLASMSGPATRLDRLR
jgi:hypothetical protein